MISWFTTRRIIKQQNIQMNINSKLHIVTSTLLLLICLTRVYPTYAAIIIISNNNTTTIIISGNNETRIDYEIKDNNHRKHQLIGATLYSSG